MNRFLELIGSCNYLASPDASIKVLFNVKAYCRSEPVQVIWSIFYKLSKFISADRIDNTFQPPAESDGLRTGFRRKPDSIPMIADSL